jgi:hypothetical protein
VRTWAGWSVWFLDAVVNSSSVFARGCYNLASRKRPATSNGEVAEWSNVPDSKSGVRVTVPWVRIPPSPPRNKIGPLGAFFILWRRGGKRLRASRVGFEAARVLARGRPAEGGRIPPFAGRRPGDAQQSTSCAGLWPRHDASHQPKPRAQHGRRIPPRLNPPAKSSYLP